MASMINKAKAAVDPNHHTATTHSTTTNHAEGAHGPHSSRAANAADPRIDSDRDGGHMGQDTHVSHTGTGVGHTGTGVGHSTHTSAGTGGGYTNTGAGYGTTGHSNTTAGPHSSDMLNKADPRVDSDRSNASHIGGGTGMGNNHNTHSSGLTGGTHGTTHNSGLTGGTTHGTTHSSGLTGTHAGNTPGNHTGTTGGISHSTNAGPHDSNLANKADPRVDSDLDSKGNRHGAATGGILGAHGSHATPGSGTAQNTAGPHNSDMLNKLDPRVDSDLDGSKTFGGNKTHH